MRRFLHFIAGLLGIFVLLAIVQYLPAPRQTYFWDAAYDTGHILVFGIANIMSLLMIRAFLGSYQTRWQYLSACLLTLGLGVLVEIWQSQHGRTAEWIDVYNDMIGILVFACIYAAVDTRIEERKGWLQSRVLAILAIVVLFLGLIPFYRTVDLYRVRNQLFPVLVDWEQPWYAIFYYEQSGEFALVNPPKSWPRDAMPAGKVAKIRLTNKGKYPGIVFREPYPDWSGYSAIELDVFYDAAAAKTFVFRAHDFSHGTDYNDRFSRELTLNPGFQTIHIALEELQITRSGRILNLEQIDGFALFTKNVDAEAELTLFLSNARLIR